MQQPLRPSHPTRTLLLIPLLSIGLLAGCAQPPGGDGEVGRGLAVNACINRCQATKDKCDADARYDFAQCEAGYSTSWSDYRWCQSSALGTPNCGYPWWSCSQNLYGYCSNRYWECRDACRAKAQR